MKIKSRPHIYVPYFALAVTSCYLSCISTVSPMQTSPCFVLVAFFLSFFFFLKIIYLYLKYLNLLFYPVVS